MKGKFLFLLLLACSLTAVQSCTKEGNRLFKGYFSFKTAGVVTVERTSKSENQPVTDTVKLSLTPENGQMNILSVDENNGSMEVTMNVLGGTLLRMEAMAVGNVLSLIPSQRFVDVADGLLVVKLDVSVSGSAKRYDDVVVFDMQYQGEGDNANYHYRIIDSKVDCVARSND